MGAFSEKILGNDNSLDVYEDYFELYNSGENLEEISNVIYKKYITKSADIIENVEYLSALCKAKWETKALKVEEIQKLKDLVLDPELLKLLVSFGASDKYISKRIKELNNFISKISIPINEV